MPRIALSVVAVSRAVFRTSLTFSAFAYLLRNGILNPQLLGMLRRHIVLLLRVRGRRLLDNGRGIGLSACRLCHLGVVLLQIRRIDLLLVLGQHQSSIRRQQQQQNACGRDRRTATATISSHSVQRIHSRGVAQTQIGTLLKSGGR